MSAHKWNGINVVARYFPEIDGLLFCANFCNSNKRTCYLTALSPH